MSLLNLRQSLTLPLLKWYDQHGRKTLPWQLNKTAYSVWISEIMLQQTQVQTVISYYERFMKQFPSIQHLASANLDDVLALWSGLGYYSRARNIHKTAKIVVNQYDGIFPEVHDKLIELPGIGPSTASAICSLVYNQHTAIMDGNVKRVLARYFAIPGDLNQSVNKKNLQQLAIDCMCSERCADYTQAIMDLGALCCTYKTPSCTLCPLSNSCTSYQNGKVNEFPEKKAKTKKNHRILQTLVLQNSDQQILMKKRPNEGIWGGLWSFPLFEDLGVVSIQDDLPKIGLNMTNIKKSFELKHTLTHLSLQITVNHIHIDSHQNNLFNKQEYLWLEASEILNIGIPKPVRDILNNINKTYI